VRVLLDLPGVEHALQSAGLLRKLEEPLPLIFRQQRLLEGRAAHVLGLALGLPGGNLLLLTGKRSLVVLEVVVLCVMGFDGIQKQIAVLFQERVDAQGQVVKVRGEGIRLGDWAVVECRQRCRELQRLGREGSRQLVKERCEEVRVVDLDRQLNKDILVAEARLLKSIQT
jgi:hypothetical protein